MVISFLVFQLDFSTRRGKKGGFWVCFLINLSRRRVIVWGRVPVRNSSHSSLEVVFLIGGREFVVDEIIEKTLVFDAGMEDSLLYFEQHIV